GPPIFQRKVFAAHRMGNWASRPDRGLKKRSDADGLENASVVLRLQPGARARPQGGSGGHASRLQPARRRTALHDDVEWIHAELYGVHPGVLRRSREQE